MIWQYFTNEQLCILAASTLCLLFSYLLFDIGYKPLSIVLLFAGSLLVGYFAAILDPFLNIWDEQYHALVAKNLSMNPLMPVLIRNPLLPVDYTQWISCHVWLHKQPLFLWQMALSIKILGPTVLAVRLPSIIMHAIIPLFIYRIGKNTVDERSGMLGGIFFAMAFFPLELTSGYIPTEHNDIAFLFYVTASIWAFSEYIRSKNIFWAILTGVFSGGAVLVKWLTGLLVFSGWTVWLLLDEYARKNRKYWYAYLMSIIACLMVFIPWQIYITMAFPRESAYEYAYNSQHFFRVVEGHGGDALFHLRAIYQLYGSGDLMPYLVAFSLVLLVLKTREVAFRWSVPVWIVLIYTFFTLAATKMTAFTIVTSSVVFLGFGLMISRFLSWSKKYLINRKVHLSVSMIVILLVCWLFLNLNDIANNHTRKDRIGRGRHHLNSTQVQFLQQLNGKLPANTVIFTDWFSGNIPIMFFTDYISYKKIPDDQTIKEVIKKGYRVALLCDSIPATMLNRQDVQIIPYKMTK